jgi:hypothetical protein
MSLPTVRLYSCLSPYFFKGCRCSAPFLQFNAMQMKL